MSKYSFITLGTLVILIGFFLTTYSNFRPENYLTQKEIPPLINQINHAPKNLEQTSQALLTSPAKHIDSSSSALIPSSKREFTEPQEIIPAHLIEVPESELTSTEELAFQIAADLSDSNMPAENIDEIIEAILPYSDSAQKTMEAEYGNGFSNSMDFSDEELESEVVANLSEAGQPDDIIYEVLEAVLPYSDSETETFNENEVMADLLHAETSSEDIDGILSAISPDSD